MTKYDRTTKGVHFVPLSLWTPASILPENRSAMADWYVLLRCARRDLGLSPAYLAERAGVSEASVRAYEMGRRHPTREHLAEMLNYLRLDRRSRNEVLIAAGFAPDAIDMPDGSLSRRDAAHLVHERPWPAFVLNEVMEIVASNRIGGRLMGLTRHDLDDRVERNVLVIAARVVAAPTTDQMRDWGVVARRVIARMKAVGVGTLDDPDPYFAAILERIARGGRGLVREFAAQWEETQPEGQPSVSWSYPARWTLRDGRTLNLHCVAARVNSRDPIEIHDLIPADAASAGLLYEGAAARPGRQR